MGRNNKYLTWIKSKVRLCLEYFYLGFEMIKKWIDMIFSKSSKKKQLIICGYPRSGTSMFYNMISSTLLHFSLDEWETSAKNSIWKYDNCASKSPVDIFCTQEIMKNNIHKKDLLFVVLERDIRDVITSKHQFDPDNYVIGYEGAFSFLGEFPNYRKKFNGPGVKEYYDAINKMLDSENIMLILIKYEELVSDPDLIQFKF